MALNFYELKDSRPLDRTVSSASVSLKHIGMYSTDETAVYAAYKALTGSVFDGLPRQRIRCDPQGAGVWLCEAEFGFSANTQTDSPDAPVAPDDTTNLGPTMSFDITAQQVHVTQSKATRYLWGNVPAANFGSNLFSAVGDARKVTAAPPDTGAAVGGDVGRYLIITGANGWTGGIYKITGTTGPAWNLDPAGPAPAPANTFNGQWTLWDGADKLGGGSGSPNYRQAIGVTQDRVEGTDIYYPHFEFGINVQVFPFTLPAMRTIAALCGKTNNAPFRNFQTGQVLYLGATGQCNPDLVWSISHKFAVGENLVAVPVSPPEIIVPTKGAWEYLWCVYASKVSVNKVVQVPVGAYVEQVYDSADFSLLGLGV